MPGGNWPAGTSQVGWGVKHAKHEQAPVAALWKAKLKYSQGPGLESDEDRNARLHCKVGLCASPLVWAAPNNPTPTRHPGHHGNRACSELRHGPHAGLGKTRSEGSVPHPFQYAPAFHAYELWTVEVSPSFINPPSPSKDTTPTRHPGHHGKRACSELGHGPNAGLGGGASGAQTTWLEYLPPKNEVRGLGAPSISISTSISCPPVVNSGNFPFFHQPSQPVKSWGIRPCPRCPGPCFPAWAIGQEWRYAHQAPAKTGIPSGNDRQFVIENGNC